MCPDNNRAHFYFNKRYIPKDIPKGGNSYVSTIIGADIGRCEVKLIPTGM